MSTFFHIAFMFASLIALAYWMGTVEGRLSILECRTAVYFPDKSPEEAIKICEGLLK